MPAPETLIAIHAHPDDEAVDNSAYTERAVQADKDVHMVHVSYGDATTVNHLLPTVTFEDIKKGYRRAEADAVSAEMRIPPEHRYHWGLPDGKLWLYEPVLIHNLATLVLDSGATEILAPGLDLFETETGPHPDHQKLRRVARLVRRALLYHGEPAPAVWTHPGPHQQADFAVPVNPLRKAMLLAEHRTQVNTRPPESDQVSFFGQVTDVGTVRNFRQYTPLFYEENYVAIPDKFVLGSMAAPRAEQIVGSILRARNPNIANKVVIPL